MGVVADPLRQETYLAPSAPSQSGLCVSLIFESVVGRLNLFSIQL